MLRPAPLQSHRRANQHHRREHIADACAFAWHQLLTHQPNRETVFAWLATVARRKAIKLDQLQRRQLVPDFDLMAELREDPHDVIDARAGLLDVQRQLLPLKDQQKGAVVLRAMGWTYEDAAKRLGVDARQPDPGPQPRDTSRTRGGTPDACGSAQRRHSAAGQTSRRATARSTAFPASGDRPAAADERRQGRSTDAIGMGQLGSRDRRHRVAHGTIDPARAFGSSREHHPPPDRLLERIERLNAQRSASRRLDRGLER